MFWKSQGSGLAKCCPQARNPLTAGRLILRPHPLLDGPDLQLQHLQYYVVFQLSSVFQPSRQALVATQIAKSAMLQLD